VGNSDLQSAYKNVISEQYAGEGDREKLARERAELERQLRKSGFNDEDVAELRSQVAADYVRNLKVETHWLDARETEAYRRELDLDRRRFALSRWAYVVGAIALVTSSIALIERSIGTVTILSSPLFQIALGGVIGAALTMLISRSKR
jgi:hypothetical protein